MAAKKHPPPFKFSNFFGQEGQLVLHPIVIAIIVGHTLMSRSEFLIAIES